MLSFLPSNLYALYDLVDSLLSSILLRQHQQLCEALRKRDRCARAARIARFHIVFVCLSKSHTQCILSIIRIPFYIVFGLNNYDADSILLNQCRKLRNAFRKNCLNECLQISFRRYAHKSNNFKMKHLFQLTYPVIVSQETAYSLCTINIL